MPDPSRDEVLVKVAAAGICGSDLHIIDGHTAVSDFPRTLGHEVAGTIDAVGSQVSGVEVGDRVCVNFLVTCGACSFCRLGRESLCVGRQGIGVHRDGGFAEYLVAPARNVVSVLSRVPLEQAAIATDALATPYHAITKRAQIRPGTSVAVIGLGGLGTSAVQLLALFGAYPIVGLDPDGSSRRRAEERGATATFDAQSDSYASWLGSGEPPHCVFDFVGAPSTVQLGSEMLSRGGRLVVVGHSHEEIRLMAGTTIVREELEVVGSYAFERSEIEELIRLMGLGRLDVANAISHRVPLSQIAQGIDLLRTRRGGPSRVVVVPD